MNLVLLYQNNNLELNYAELLKITSLEEYSLDNQIKILGLLFDLSLDNKNAEGIDLGLTLSKQVIFDSLSKRQQVLYHYYLANGWSTKRKFNLSTLKDSWDFNILENGKEIFHLRKAISLEGFKSISGERRCQIYTNLANLFNFLGRFVDAQEYWHKALHAYPEYPTALANQGNGIFYYGKYLYDDGHINIFMSHSFKTLKSSLTAPKRFDPATLHGISELYNWLNNNFIKGRKSDLFDLNGFDLGKDARLKRYREWSLKQQLYINPLNDLGAYNIACHDCLNLPNITLPSDQPPFYLTMFNQMKQEFGTARFLFYESTISSAPHYADKDIIILDTNESALYSYASEKTKIAFRLCYSIFDKISFFLNAYLNLKIPDTQVNFKKIWYTNYDKKELRTIIKDSQNWALRGLFWLSKDLHWAWETGETVIEPEARDIAAIRNHIEHKSFKLIDDKNFFPLYYDEKKDLSFSISRTDFENKVLKLLKLSRAAMIYLSLAVNQEEKKTKKITGISYPVDPRIIPFSEKK